MNLNEFTKKMKERLGDNLQSIVLYGSAAQETDYSKDFSDVNLIVVLNDASPAVLSSVNDIVRKWVKADNPFPHFFDPKHIETSADVFPLEFLDIMDRRKVLIGDKDPFADVQVDKKNLRHQCESELKGKILHLRAFYTAHCHKPKLIAQMAVSSWSQIRPSLKGVMHLYGEKPPAGATELVEKLSAKIKFNPQPFLDILAIRDGSKVMPRKVDALELFEGYLTAIEAITTCVDRFC